MSTSLNIAPAFTFAKFLPQKAIASDLSTVPSLFVSIRSNIADSFSFSAPGSSGGGASAALALLAPLPISVCSDLHAARKKRRAVR